MNAGRSLFADHHESERPNIFIAIADDLDLPVRFVGLGEGPDDLDDFDAENFVRALFEG